MAPTLTYEHADSGHELTITPVFRVAILDGDASLGEPPVWAEARLTGAYLNRLLIDRHQALRLFDAAWVRAQEVAEEARCDHATMVATVTRADERRDELVCAA